MTVDAPAVPATAAHIPHGRRLMIRMAGGVGVGAVFVVLFLQLVNVRSVLRRLEHLDVPVALLCGAVFLAAYVVRALRWRRFLAPAEVPATRVIGIYFVATFLNWLLPVQAGEVAKCGMLRRTDGIPISSSLATVAVDKAMDLLPAVVLVTVIPLAGLDVRGALWLFLLFPITVLAAGAALLALASRRPRHATRVVTRTLYAVLPDRVAARVEPSAVRFLETVLGLVRRPRLLATAVAYTALAVTLDALFCYLAFLAVGMSLGLGAVLYGYTLYNLAYIFPTPPAHLGSNELIGLLIFSGIFGVSRAGVGAMFLFSHPFTGLLMTISALASLKAIRLDVRSALAIGSDPSTRSTS